MNRIEEYSRPEKELLDARKSVLLVGNYAMLNIGRRKIMQQETRKIDTNASLDTSLVRL